MKQPLPRIQTAVPRSPHVQLEIAKAIRTLMGPDEDERVRARRAEITAIRGDLDALARDLPRAFAEAATLAKAEMWAVLAKTYNSDQPRAPAGNRDGGQWTSGPEDLSETSLDQSDDEGANSPHSRLRYAQADTAVSDAAVSSRASANTAGQDSSVAGNLRGVFHTWWTVHDRGRQNIWSYELPADHPRAPTEFRDSDGNPITDDQDRPILRPTNMPPERYVAAGLANQSLGELVRGYKQQIAQGGLAAEGVSPTEPLALALLPVSPGGLLDAERFDFKRVRDYRHYLNIMIGVYGAAAGLDQDDVLSTIDDYAKRYSHFAANERLDDVYTHSARQDVQDTKLGFALYQSGRIRLTK